MRLTQIEPLGKGQVRLSFDASEPFILYERELRTVQVPLHEQMELDDALYRQLFYEIAGRRVTKRAMHLLERRDLTEAQLREKLARGQYPQELIERAVSYVRSYRYIDDERYARTYVRLNQERKSSGRMRMDLLARGVSAELIALALEEENETDPQQMMRRLLEKRSYDFEGASRKERQKAYQFLLRRGFRSDEIMHVLTERLFK